MCLCEYHKFTFTNREAYDRLIPIIEGEYSKYLPKGEVFIVRDYTVFGLSNTKQKRNKLTYDELMNEVCPKFERIDYYSILNWDDWYNTKEDIKNEQDIFGYIEVEVY